MHDGEDQVAGSRKLTVEEQALIAAIQAAYNEYDITANYGM